MQKHRFGHWFLALALGIVASQVHADDKLFQGNYALAQKNASSKAGTAYDNQLGAAMQNAPGFKASFKECTARHPGNHAVHGYFRFGSPTSYLVHLRPQNAFSACLTKALEGKRVPAPPRLPYLNPFNLVQPAR